MSDNSCYLCQEPKSIVVQKIWAKGSNLSLNVDQKHDGNVCPRKKMAALKGLCKDYSLAYETFFDEIKDLANETKSGQK